MPHDLKGNELVIGDRVLIEAEVVEVYPGSDDCNVLLSAVQNPEADVNRSIGALSSKLVEKAGAPA